ncbi:MAG TPA: SRPBCC domain-containing protein, partial [Hyphomonadaceae bacterium]|nr:SRPBCC domain-containing protein [Hyphomonadaceae bacterium]
MGLTIGRLHVRRGALINASPRQVWQEFSTEERIRAWFGQGHTLHTFEPKPGGKIDMSVEHDFG